MKRLISILLTLIIALAAHAQYELTSPDGNIQVALRTNRARKGASRFFVPTKMTMDVTKGKRQILMNREIGLTSKCQGRRCSFGKTDIVLFEEGENLVDLPESKDERLAQMLGSYNCMHLETKEGMLLEVRAYNNGVAYRFTLYGFPSDYKILEVCNAFPHEKPIAILGTFTEDYIMPWRTMVISDNENDNQWTDFPAVKAVSWTDALTSIRVGSGIGWYNGNNWKHISQSHSFMANVIYKHLFTGIGYTPCHELLYLHWDEDYPPFNNVMGSIHQWSLTGRLGYSLPIQNRYDTWTFSAYGVSSLMHLQQHGKLHPRSSAIQKHHYNLVGAGIDIQYSMRGGYLFGVGYEHQFFTGKQCPSGLNSLNFTIGRLF